jgi:hypothetical protein
MAELQLPGLAGRELLDVSYTDYNCEASYVAKMGQHKLRVRVKWSGPNYSYAYAEVFNAERTWTRLVEEPYENWGEAMQAASLHGPRRSAEHKAILDAVAARLFIRAERIMEA